MKGPDTRGSRLRRGIRHAVESHVSDRAEAGSELRTAVADLTRGRLALTNSMAALRARTPFRADTTMHQAWSRHPGVREIFAGYHLMACDHCAVGADETLAEAATGYHIPLTALLSTLNALLETPSTGPHTGS